MVVEGGNGAGGAGRRHGREEGGSTSTSSSAGAMSASLQGAEGGGGGQSSAQSSLVPMARWRGSFAQRRRFFDAGEEKLDDEDISVRVDGVNELEARAGKHMDAQNARDGGGGRRNTASARIGTGSPSPSPGPNPSPSPGGWGGSTADGRRSSTGGGTPASTPVPETGSGTGTDKHMAQLRLQREHSLEYSKKRKNTNTYATLKITPERYGLLYIISKYTGVRRENSSVPQVLPGAKVGAATPAKTSAQIQPPRAVDDINNDDNNNSNNINNNNDNNNNNQNTKPSVDGDIDAFEYAKVMKLVREEFGVDAKTRLPPGTQPKDENETLSRVKMRRHSAPEVLALPPPDHINRWKGPNEVSDAESTSTSPSPAEQGSRKSTLLSKWMRKSSTMVLIFEAVVNGFFDYDYAPALMKVAEDLTYMNVSQLAMDDLHNLSQRGFINQLLLTTHSQQVSTAYGITSSGLELLLEKRVEFLEIIRKLDQILYCDKNGKSFSEDALMELDQDGHSDDYLIKTRFISSDGDFLLYNEAGYASTSLATFIEDVTYVSSPVFFACCRSASSDEGDHAGDTGSNSVESRGVTSKEKDDDDQQQQEEQKQQHQGRQVDITNNERVARNLIHDCKMKRRDVLSNVKGSFAKKLSLANVQLYLAEWIPFGRNHVANVCSRLMLESKGCGGLFSSVTDRNTNDSTVEHSMEAIGNCMSVVDMTEGSHINFVAEVYLPEQSGITQVEDVGVHFHHDGSVVYGSRIDTVMGAEPNNSSLDLLTRVLVDLEQDTGFITSNLLTMYQRVMLDTLYCSASQCRPKYRVILADGLKANGQPVTIDELMAEDYDGFKNDLRKLVGEIERIHHVPSQISSTLIAIGRVGAIIIGYHGDRASRRCPVHQEIWRWLSWRGKKSAIEAFIARVYQVGDILGKLREKLNRFEEDPKALTKIELMHSESMHELINLEEVLLHLSDSTAIGNKAHSETERATATRLATDDRSAATQASPSEAANSESDYTPEQVKTNDAIISFLGLKAMMQDVTARIRDLKIALQASRHELESLRQMTTFIQSQKSYSQTQALIVNTKNMEDVFRSNERSSNSLEIMQIILAGRFVLSLSLCVHARLISSLEESYFSCSVSTSDRLLLPANTCICNVCVCVYVCMYVHVQSGFRHSRSTFAVLREWLPGRVRRLVLCTIHSAACALALSQPLFLDGHELCARVVDACALAVLRRNSLRTARH